MNNIEEINKRNNQSSNRSQTLGFRKPRFSDQVIRSHWRLNRNLFGVVYSDEIGWLRSQRRGYLLVKTFHSSLHDGSSRYLWYRLITPAHHRFSWASPRWRQVDDTYPRSTIRRLSNVLEVGSLLIVRRRKSVMNGDDMARGRLLELALLPGMDSLERKHGGEDSGNTEAGRHHS